MTLTRKTPMNPGKGFKPKIKLNGFLQKPNPLMKLVKERDPDRVRSTPTATTAFRQAAPVQAHAAPVLKGPPASPGKKAPNVEERAWMDWIVSRGCIACRMDGHEPRPTAVHHILRGGVRMGHLYTLPLCDPGHHQGGESIGLVSRHPHKARFEERYGTELVLLDALQKERANGC